jgi:predicted acylesterase/phospholipase RssA
MGPAFSVLVLVGAGALLVAAWIVLAIDPIWVGASLSSLIGILAGAVLATTFRGVLARLYVVVLTLTLVWVVGGPWLLPWPAALRFLTLLVLMAVWIALIAGRRSAICERAYQDTFFSPGERATRLADIHDDLDHVFCATELQSSESLYFSKQFVAGYRYGIGNPGETTLARAVQASACLPFAFAPRWFAYKPFGFKFPSDDEPPIEQRAKGTKYLVLTDGGVYDNMATQWGTGYENRITWWRELATSGRRPTHLIVANASAGKGWQLAKRSAIPGAAEIGGMLAIKDVLYDQTTAPRRRALVAAFDQAAAAARVVDDSEEAHQRIGLLGTIVDISQSPFTVPKQFENSRAWPERAERAREAIAALGALGISEDAWRKDSKKDAEIGTVLHRLGLEVSARLLHHAYVLAAVNAWVVLGFKMPEPLPSRDVFMKLVDDSHEEAHQ